MCACPLWVCPSFLLRLFCHISAWLAALTPCYLFISHQKSLPKFLASERRPYSVYLPVGISSTLLSAPLWCTERGAKARYLGLGGAALPVPQLLLCSYQLLFEATQIAIHVPAPLPHSPICWARAQKKVEFSVRSSSLAEQSQASAPAWGLRTTSPAAAARGPGWGWRKSAAANEKSEGVSSTNEKSCPRGAGWAT